MRLSPTQQSSAKDAGKLQQKIIEELAERYYVPVSVDKLSTAGVNGMLGSLKDPYTVYLTPKEVQDFAEKEKGSYSGIGASLQKTKDGLVISTVFAGSPAKAAGLVPGDIIQAVDGQSTKDAAIETSISRIKGAEGSTVTLTIQPKDRKQPPKDVKLARKTIVIPETTKRIIDDKGTKVGYIQLYEFGGLAGVDVRQDVEALKKRGAQWFILDLRYNGGGLLTQAVDVTNVFQTGLVTSTSGLHSPKEELTANGPVATSRPMVVLVNGFSASASEIVTGALKDHKRATIIGTTTFGKGLVQTIVDLGNGAALKLTTAVYLTPNGTNINKKGITPDIVAPDKPRRSQTTRCRRRCGTSPAARSSSMSPSRHPGGPGDSARHAGGRRPQGGGRRGQVPDQAQEDRGRPLPYRVARWGKFWSLEPLFADVRSYLVAKGGVQPRADDLVLAVPSHGDRRRIVEVLGGADDLTAVLRALLHARGVRQGFSGAVLDEAAAVKARAARPDHGRRDLTALPTFTIDPDTARDFDDAISVAREGLGYRAHVHIADVSYFVDDDGEIEREARRRTSSLYLPAASPSPCSQRRSAATCAALFRGSRASASPSSSRSTSRAGAPARSTTARSSAATTGSRTALPTR